MLRIQLHNNILSLPDSWDDLDSVKIIYALHILNTEKLKYMAQLKLLYLFTNYKPSFFTRKREHKENIAENLLNLSKLITFPFSEDDDGNPILNNRFKKNPIPFIRLGFKTVKGMKFDIGDYVKTNITAIQFADAYELVRDYSETQSEESLRLLVAILYPSRKLHSEIINSDYSDRFKKIDIKILHAVFFWFTGVIRFFMEDETYKILFRKGEKKPDDYISLGFSETILSLSGNGYGDVDKIKNINVVDFFDLQIRNLKNIIQNAVSKGVKLEDIAQSMNISFTTINRLC